MIRRVRLPVLAALVIGALAVAGCGETHTSSTAPSKRHSAINEFIYGGGSEGQKPLEEAEGRDAEQNPQEERERAIEAKVDHKWQEAYAQAERNGTNPPPSAGEATNEWNAKTRREVEAEMTRTGSTEPSGEQCAVRESGTGVRVAYDGVGTRKICAETIREWSGKNARWYSAPVYPKQAEVAGANTICSLRTVDPTDFAAVQSANASAGSEVCTRLKGEGWRTQ